MVEASLFDLHSSSPVPRRKFSSCVTMELFDGREEGIFGAQKSWVYDVYFGHS